MRRKKPMPVEIPIPRQPAIDIRFPDNSGLYAAVTELAKAIKATADALAKADVSNVSLSHFNMVSEKRSPSQPMIHIGRRQ